ncbi:MFS transporter [Snodgrassella sp. CFCC 13594]|uniref:MFS transporter n=1 Tax=Snodgrassella sp. CFCC 13594 TaxID=1775559 RepID=UPI0009EEBFDD|nr:MFS transporter [Snodgrassella sp. CFCC 13594]
MITESKTLSSWALLLLIAGQLLPQVDFSIVNVALAAMRPSLHTNETGLILIVAVYGLSFSVLMATGARLGDRYGRKKIFMLGIVGFALASTGCGLAHSIVPMLLGRFGQGIFGALLMPQILTIIHATLSGERHSKAVGIYTAAAGLSFVIGQVLGGWLVSADLGGLGWRIAFFINIPVCLVILVFGSKLIPETRALEYIPMDVGGIIWLAATLLSLLIPVVLGEHWPSLLWFLVAVAPLAWGLWRCERYQEQQQNQPLLPPSLFQQKIVRMGFLGEMTVTFIYSGYLFVTALFLQSVLHYTPAQSGNAFLVLGILFFVTSLLSKRLASLVRLSKLLAIGALLSALGMASIWLVFWQQGTATAIWDLSASMALVGVGNALMVSSSFRMVLSHVRTQQASAASSALTTIQQACFALGTSVAGALYSVMLPLGSLLAVAMVFGLLMMVLLVSGSRIGLSCGPNCSQIVLR